MNIQFAELIKVIKDQFRMLLFLSFKPNLNEMWRIYLAWGLLITWLVGIGRYWDHPSADIWQYAGLGSVVYVFFLAVVIWLVLLPFRIKQFSYRNILIFITLTSLPAVLYAIPVERFMSLEAARTANVWFLVVVASWRVALYGTFLRRVGKLGFGAVGVVILLPLALILTVLTSLNLEHVTFQIMGGIQNPSANDKAYSIIILISILSVFATPVLLIWYFVIAYLHRKKWSKVG